MERLRQERKLMKKALHRVKMAEKWKDAGEDVNENALSLAYQWNQVTKEEQAKAKNKKRVLKSYPSVRRALRDAVAVSVAVRGPLPTCFESLP
jgi:hypothetical protein